MLTQRETSDLEGPRLDVTAWASGPARSQRLREADSRMEARAADRRMIQRLAPAYQLSARDQIAPAYQLSAAARSLAALAGDSGDQTFYFSLSVSRRRS